MHTPSALPNKLISRPFSRPFNWNRSCFLWSCGDGRRSPSGYSMLFCWFNNGVIEIWNLKFENLNFSSMNQSRWKPIIYLNRLAGWSFRARFEGSLICQSPREPPLRWTAGLGSSALSIGWIPSMSEDKSFFSFYPLCGATLQEESPSDLSANRLSFEILECKDSSANLSCGNCRSTESGRTPLLNSFPQAPLLMRESLVKRSSNL